MGISYDPGSRKWNIVYEKTDYKTSNPTDLPETKTVIQKVPKQVLSNIKGGAFWTTVLIDTPAVVPDEDNILLNKKNKELNDSNTSLNASNVAKNKAYDKTLTIANSTQGGDYVQQRELIRKTEGIDANLKTTLENYYKAYYSNEKLQPWDSKLGAKPPYGEFDPTYYKTQNPVAAQQWQSAVANDDIDVTQRYGETGFYLNHYTTQGKPAGARGNKAEELAASKQYVEKKPTDADLEQVRDFQLGIKEEGDQKTALSETLSEALGQKTIEDVKRFGALTQDVLKQTIEEIKKAKAREQELALFNSLDSFGEIINLNRDLTQSIIGDLGAGGVLSFMGGKKTEASLEKALKGITGINNETVYNWQQWFDTTLKQRYQEGIDIGLTTEQAKESIKIDSEFAREFIEKYLTPRFNESRSMNEFVEYLDVSEKEQNPFQTQDIYNATKLVADLKANQYLEELRKTPERYFNSEFYFNPTGDKARETGYSEQAQTVNADWEKAKNGDSYWAEQAYRFGVDVKDKDAFARMHFQVKGQAKGYDPADDILNASKVSDYIYTQILPAIKQEISTQGSVFGQFVKPKEFADEMLKGLNPDDKSTWEEVLKQYGLTGFKGSIEDLKNYIAETVSTGSAQEIRRQIKYLNEKKEKPTQERLGITYIQREEDYKPESKSAGQSEIYRIFQSAGFQGTEEDFYKDFFPDLNRSEQIALTKAGTSSGLEMKKIDYSDPFAALGTVEDFFGEGQEEEEEPRKSSYFTINEDEEVPIKSKTGQGFLDEFTSLFKGFD